MKIIGRIQNWNKARQAGFTLLEMMVAVSMLTVIVYGLFRMFDQTQRALRMNNTQVDVLEGARATLDSLGRDIQQACPVEFQNNGLPVTVTNDYLRCGLHSFNMIGSYKWHPLPSIFVDTNKSTPEALFTNCFQSFFFLTRQDGDWLGNGFFYCGPAFQYCDYWRHQWNIANSNRSKRGRDTLPFLIWRRCKLAGESYDHR